MPKAPPPSVTWKFQGKTLGWPLANPGLDDWGLTPDQQESYVEQFRRILEAKRAWDPEEHDYFTLRRFLRARTYDLEKATTMFLNHLSWQKDFGIRDILQNYHFHERDKFIANFPQGYHKTDKVGRPIFLQQIGKMNVPEMKKFSTDERMVKFHIQEYERCRRVVLPICSRLAGRHLDQTFVIMDVKGLSMSHFSGDAKKLMSAVTKYDQDNYPEMLGHICIINAPAIFRFFWTFVKGLIDPRTQSKIEILGSDYMPALLKWIDIENIPTWIGGKSEGSLVDDIGPWSDSVVCSRIGVDAESLRTPGSKLMALPNFNMGRTSLSNSIEPGTPKSGRVSASDMSVGGRTPSKRFSGIAEEVIEETEKRLADSRTGSQTGSNGNSGQLATIASFSHGHFTPPAFGVSTIYENSGTPKPSVGGPTGPDGRPRILIDRIAALERMVPAHMKRLPQANAPGPAPSNRSAPEGSLLNRVEVLEEAMDTLLSAQEVAILEQRRAEEDRELAEAQARQRAAKEESSCCCIC